MKILISMCLVLATVVFAADLASAQGGKGGGQRGMSGRGAMNQFGGTNARGGSMQRMMMQNRYGMMQGGSGVPGAMMQQRLRYGIGYGQSALNGQGQARQQGVQAFQSGGQSNAWMNALMQQQRLQLRNGQVGNQNLEGNGQQRRMQNRLKQGPRAN